MRFCLIGPSGAMIPPYGWGAVESLIWDYFSVLKKEGHQVLILNCAIADMIERCDSYNPDLVYIMYDDYAYLSQHIACPRIYFMSHFAYITDSRLTTDFNWYFDTIFMQAIRFQKSLTINALSEEIANVYRGHGYVGKIHVIHNGAREDKFLFTSQPKYADQSIYIGKIEMRKRQYQYQSIPNIKFAGNYQDSDFDQSNPNYLGEWTKMELYESLTEYGNLVLLSDGEADPLVVKEALMAGLGVVVSECASANLDKSKDFITIIPDDKLFDMTYVEKEIAKNRDVCKYRRKAIREYALSTFSWDVVVKKFLNAIASDI